MRCTWGAVLFLSLLHVASISSLSCDAAISGGKWSFTPCLTCERTTCETASSLSCNAGYYRNETDSTSNKCSGKKTCPPSSCTACEDSYTLTEDSSTCLPCSAGRYGSPPGGLTSSACSGLCARGYYCPLGSTMETEVPCPEGTYRNSTGAADLANCTPCPRGTWSNATGATSVAACRPCPPGTWSNREKLPDISSCSLCEIDTYNYMSGSTDASACLNCTAAETAADTFSGPGSGVCVALGSWSAPFSTQRVPCAPGTYNNVARANASSACRPCPNGRWQEKSGSSSCISAKRGFYAAVTNANDTVGPTSQSPCAAGTYSSTEGGLRCELCD